MIGKKLGSQFLKNYGGIKMFRLELQVLSVILVVLLGCKGQEYDFAAEISRQCLVPDPVGLLDCVENKVTLPYLTSWVDCTNSLGENVRTSTDIINYRCKSVWEGKGVIPEVFYIKDCVIEKTGLPAKNVSAEVLGAYKECESGSSKSQQQRIKTAPMQQPLRASTVEYNRPQSETGANPRRPAQLQVQPPQLQQFQIPGPPPVQATVPVSIQGPIQQVFQAPTPRPVQQIPVQIAPQFQVPFPRPPTAMNQQIFQRPAQPQVQPQLIQVTQQQLPVAFNQQYQSQMVPQNQPQTQSRPIQQAPAVFNQQYLPQSSGPQYQVPMVPQYQPQTQSTPAQVPVAFNQQYRPQASGTAYQVPTQQAASLSRQPYSQQYFAMYPQMPLVQQQRVNQPILTQKTAAGPSYVTQQQIDVRNSNNPSSASSVPFAYSFQINHPQRPV